MSIEYTNQNICDYAQTPNIARLQIIGTARSSGFGREIMYGAHKIIVLFVEIESLAHSEIDYLEDSVFPRTIEDCPSPNQCTSA